MARRGSGRRAGSLGHAAAFSFYPEQEPRGARRRRRRSAPTTTRSPSEAARLRNLGQRRKGEHVEAGFNERLDGLQAACCGSSCAGSTRRTPPGASARPSTGKRFRTPAAPLTEDPRGDVRLPPVPGPGRRPGRARGRGWIEAGVATGVHYWPAVHRPAAVRGPRHARPQRSRPHLPRERCALDRGGVVAADVRRAHAGGGRASHGWNRGGARGGNE